MEDWEYWEYRIIPDEAECPNHDSFVMRTYCIAKRKWICDFCDT